MSLPSEVIALVLSEKKNPLDKLLARASNEATGLVGL